MKLKLPVSVSVLALALLALGGCNRWRVGPSLVKQGDAALAEKTRRIGAYLITANLAEKEGNIQAAIYLRQVANEELRHASELATSLLGVQTAKQAITSLQLLETKAATLTYPEIAAVARRNSRKNTARLFDALSIDENRHAAGLTAVMAGMP
ncbi:MAG: hypothetical protein COB53_10900 [Elusimicrobia bacterium]|nr:MAG: hypothetical protein COB53_10900 [Elusimicrobiota bacterium]